jgi:nucleoside-diphosphate-sugar epimerase
MPNSAPILVTGASGFIGQKCVESLVAQNHNVRAFVLPHEDVSNIFDDSVEVIRGDISIQEDVQRAAANISGAIHLAAVVGDFGTDELHQKITVEGTRFLLEAAAPSCRVVVISSIVYYGNHLKTHTCFEQTPPGEPVGVYSRAKQAQEQVAWAKIESGANISIVRPANVYGPNSGPWVNEICEHLKLGTPSLVNGGNTNAGLVYVDNVVDIILAAFFQDAAKGRAYNACDELDVTWRDYFSALANIIGAPKPRSIPAWAARKGATLFEAVWRKAKLKSRPPLTHEALNLIGSHHRIPTQRARNELGVSPRVNYTQGMSEVRRYLLSR